MSCTRCESLPIPQSEDNRPSVAQAAPTNQLVTPRLLISPVTSIVPTNSPGSTQSNRFPDSPTSPDSPMNPFLLPPRPHLITTALFRLASPLLPASPLSIFDCGTSPSSLNRRLSLGSPSHHNGLLRTAIPSAADHNAYDGLTPTFLYPRTPPTIPESIHASSKLVCTETGHGDVQTLEKNCVNATTLQMTSAADGTDKMETRLTKIRVELCHFLTTRWTAVVDRASAPLPSTYSRDHLRKKPWKKLLHRSKSRRKEPMQSNASLGRASTSRLNSCSTPMSAMSLPWPQGPTAA